MTREILHTRPARLDDTTAIFDMYSDLKCLKEYPAFRSNAFYRAISRIIEQASVAETLFVTTDMHDQPIGMGHLTRPFSLTGNSHKLQELSHLYVDETHSEAFATPVHLADFAASLALRSNNPKEQTQSCSMVLQKQNTNCLDIVATHYPRAAESSAVLRFNHKTLQTMASHALTQPYVVIAPASADPDSPPTQPR